MAGGTLVISSGEKVSVSVGLLLLGTMLLSAKPETRTPLRFISPPDVPTTAALKPCNNGPYVWDRSEHIEGMGATFRYRKRSIILADTLRGAWIGWLVNEHEGCGKKQTKCTLPRVNHAKWFGLGADDCNAAALAKYKELPDAGNLTFVNASQLYNTQAFTVSRMCEAKTWYKFNKNTVIEVDDADHTSVEDWNYCTFNERFRNRFYQVQTARYGRKFKSSNEIWISAHFRWGDVRTWDTEHPDGRMKGLGLLDLAKITKRWLNVVKTCSRGAGAIRVFLFSEGAPKEFNPFLTAVPNVELRVNESWQDSVWTMSQSDVLIGGESAFFALGAFLCKKCTVVTPGGGHTSKKFRVHAEENSMRTHHREENANFQQTLSCSPWSAS